MRVRVEVIFRGIYELDPELDDVGSVLREEEEYAHRNIIQFLANTKFTGSKTTTTIEEVE